MTTTSTKWLPYPILFLLVWFCYLRELDRGFLDASTQIHEHMIILLILLGCAGGIYLIHSKAEDRFSLFAWMLLLAGLILRIGYTLYTPIVWRSHDLGDISTAGNGHAAYILNLYQNHALPVSYDYQFYHPPLFHWLSAEFMQLLHRIRPALAMEQLLSVSRLVSCIAGCSMLFLVKRILEELQFTPRMSCIVLGMTAFFPNLILMSGRVNNDCTSYAFYLWALLALIKWIHKQQIANLMELALAIGLGMMTKLSVGAMAFIAGPVMIYYLIQSIRKKTWVKQLISYGAFLAICAPLGLWYSIRNLRLFAQPLGYVLDLDAEGPSFIYVGDHSLMERFFTFPWKNFFQIPFNDSGNDYQLWPYFMRSAMFGEFSYDNVEPYAQKLLYIWAILGILILIAIIWVLVKQIRKPSLACHGTGLVTLISLITYVGFNLRFPDGCTMDYRYIALSSITSGIFLALWFKELSTGLKTVQPSSFSKALYQIAMDMILLVLSLFAISSTLFFCHIV